MPVEPDISTLAQRQLDAYNAADLDAFVACYHPEVVVLNQGEVSVRGRAAFRERYEALFRRGGFGASVPGRLAEGRHCVDLEIWWREQEGGERREGRVLVRYTLRDGLIGEVQFLD